MSHKFPYSHAPRGAFVIFSDASTLPFLGLLKSGFRHCFVIIPFKEAWLSIDPLWGRIEIMTHDAPVDHRFIDIFRNGGLSIVYTEIKGIPHHLPFGGILSCVSIVKRILGVRAWGVQTPYGLYKYLRAGALKKSSHDPFHELFLHSITKE